MKTNDMRRSGMARMMEQLLDLELWYAELCSRQKRIPLWQAVVQCTDAFYSSQWFLEDGDDRRHDCWIQFLQEHEDHLLEPGFLFQAVLRDNLPELWRREQAFIAASFGGFQYEFHPQYYSEDPELLLTLHFRNAFAPESPFGHVSELREGLLAILERAHREHPEVRMVQCASWLNHVKAFRGLFPESWWEHRQVCRELEGSLGWWGAFINRRGEFDREHGEAFRRKPVFAMPNTICTCEMSELEGHLKSMMEAFCGIA